MKKNTKITALMALQNLQAYAMQDDWGNRFNPLTPEELGEMLAAFTPRDWYAMQVAMLAINGER